MNPAETPAQIAALLVELLTVERDGLSPRLHERRSRLRALFPRLFARHRALR